MQITGISSMATRQILNALSKRYEEKTGTSVAIEAMGGVDAARAVRNNQPTDLVILASDVMSKLEAEGFVLPGSIVGLARSGMAIAVRAGTPHPEIGNADAVKRAIAAANKIGYSTGPSGDHLLRLCADWGFTDMSRMIKAPPGVPVASLVAQGQVDLGFQQLSELLHVPGIEIVGPLPPEIQTVTVFAAGVAKSSKQPEEARALIAFLASLDNASVKRDQGMDPA
jgi:molybdate transport system substrate-binding protein